MNILKVGHNFQVLICGMFQLAMFKETFKTNFNVKEAKSVAVLRDPRPYGAKGHS